MSQGFRSFRDRISGVSLSLILNLAFGFSSESFAARGDLIKMEKIGKLGQAALDFQRQLALPDAPSDVENGVIFYKLTYESEDLQKQPMALTGLMIVPDKIKAGAIPPRTYSLLSYQHGTIMRKSDAPSNGTSSEAKGMALLYGGIGYVIAEADYIGLGDSPGFHPFLHADSEAWASADMLRATRLATQKLEIPLDSKLFLTGYSQGGHSTMALHYYLESQLAGEFKVTASAPMAGPYDLSNTSWRQVIQNPSPHSTAEAAYLLMSMEKTYGLSGLVEEAVKLRYVGRMYAMLDGTHTMDEAVKELPKTPKEFLRPEFVEAVLSNPNHPLILALAKNDVYNWRPLAPVSLFQGGSDNEVPYMNSEVAYARMKDLGAEVYLYNVGDDLDHASAITPAVTQSSAWFERLKGHVD